MDLIAPLDHIMAAGYDSTLIITFQTYTAISRKVRSGEVHTTIPKGIVGGFVFTQVLQGNLKELHERPWTYVCEC